MRIRSFPTPHSLKHAMALCLNMGLTQTVCLAAASSSANHTPRQLRSTLFLHPWTHNGHAPLHCKTPAHSADVALPAGTRDAHWTLGRKRQFLCWLMLVNLLENRGKNDERYQSGTTNMHCVQKGRAGAISKSARLGCTRTGASRVCRSEQIINFDSQNGEQRQTKNHHSHLPELQSLPNSQTRRTGLPEPWVVFLVSVRP